MTVTVLKTEYVKADPIQVNYRDYKNFNVVIFREELRTKLSEDPAPNNDYILYGVVSKHAPQKKKYLRTNDSPFMTKHLRKRIMNRSRSKNAYIKNKTVDNWEKYRILRNKCVKESNITKNYLSGKGRNHP